MSGDKKGLMAEDIPEGAEADKQASSQEKATGRWLEIEEGDRADRSKLAAEHLEGIRQMRKIRNIAFWVMLTLLVFSSAAVLALGVAVACYDFVATVPGSEYGGGFPSPWPKVVFISGTFLMFILVFGAFVKGVFAVWRDKGDDGATPLSRRDALDIFTKMSNGPGGP